MGAIKDHLRETTMMVSLDGAKPGMVVDLNLGQLQVENRLKMKQKAENEKMDRFLSPTDHDVIVGLENVLEKKENKGKMVVDLEAGRLVAFRMVGGKDGAWERVPPVDSWKDKGDEYCYFFAIEPVDDWSNQLFLRYSNVLSPRRDEHPGNYFGLKVYTKSFSSGFDGKGPQIVGRCGYCDANEDSILETVFNDDAKVTGSFHYLMVDGKKINTTLSSWPPNYGNAPSRDVRTLQNRMLLMTIGGDCLPAKYREDKVILGDYIYEGGALVNLLINEGLFDINEEMETQLNKQIADAKKIKKALADRYAFGEIDRFRRPIPIEVSLNEKKSMTNLFSLIKDSGGLLFNGLNNNDGKYELGDWQFEVDVSEPDIDGLHEINGIKIRNKSIEGWELFIFNNKPEKVYEGELMEIVGATQNIKVNRMVLRMVV